MTYLKGEAEEALVDFLWPVPTAGFRIEAGTFLGTAKPQRCLVAEPSNEVELYNPLVEQRSLFRVFGELGPGDLSIVSFAKRHGMLSEGSMTGRSSSHKMALQAEPLSLWKTEIHAMRLAIDLLDALRIHDVAALLRWLSFHKRGSQIRVAYTGQVKGSGILTRLVIADESLGINSWRVEFLKEDKVALAGSFALQDMLNRRLTAHVTARTLFLCPPNRTAALQGGETSVPLGLRLVPKNLLGALWLQLARAVDEGREYRRCVACEKWMEISLEVFRKNRRTCSERCRQKAQRQRRAQVRKMHSRGLGVEEIAQKLGARPSAVRAWLKKPIRPRGRPRTRRP